MILLLLGTNPYPFDRLLHAVNRWANVTDNHVIAQTGHTPAENLVIDCHDFVDYSQIVKWIEDAEFVISQGGFGSLQDCIRRNKTVIAVPRYPELNESMDSQMELVTALSEEGYVIPLYEVEKLADAIDHVKRHRTITHQKSAIPGLVANLIEEYI